jgi:hypothetical protein
MIPIPLACALSLFVSASSPWHFRIGLHASEHDLSPLLGAEASTGHFGASLDGWIRPGYWKTLEQESSTRWVQRRILRYGFVAGAYALVGTRRLGLLPMAGMEFVTGDISGSSRFPEGEANPWVGGGVALAERLRIDVRETLGEGVLGHTRVDMVVVF